MIFYRLLSKVSLTPEYAVEIMKTDCCDFLVTLLKESIGRPFVFVRIAFILGNLTMIFGTACTSMYSDPNAFDVVFNAMIFYLDTVCCKTIYFLVERMAFSTSGTVW